MNAGTMRWALWSGAGAAGIAALAVIVFFATRTHPQPPAAQTDQLDASFRPVATQMSNLQHRLVIYDMTLAMRVERGALNSADVQPALLQRVQELEARDVGDAPLVGEQAQEAASYFQFIDSRIAGSSTWPTDKPAETYRAIAQFSMKQARQDYDKAMQRSFPPTLALDEASWALALSNGIIANTGQPTAFDRAHDEIVALVRDYAQGKVHPPSSHVPDNNGAVAGSADSSLAVTADAGAPAGVAGGISRPPGDATGEQEATIDSPEVDHLPLDSCRIWENECGQPAADAYCVSQGYARASHFTTEDVASTRVLSSLRVCSPPHPCGRIASVTCTKSD